MEVIVRNFSAEKVEQIANVLKAISHPLRLEIIGLLEVESPLSVAEIMKVLQVEQSVLSHHLTKMKDKGILMSKRDGRNIYYAIKLVEITTIFDCMEHCKL